MSRVGNIDIRISIYRNTEIVFSDCFEYRNTEIQAKPISVFYRITEIQAKPISVLYRNTEIQALPIFGILPNYRNSKPISVLYRITVIQSNRNWQRFTQSTFGKRSHAHTNKLMYSIRTLYKYALPLTAHSVLQIDFAIICQWTVSRLFPNRSDTVNAVRRCWQAWKQSFTYYC